MKPKIEDVARLAGVSPTTVSRVLNNRGYISEKTRQKVEDSMKELNYYPNEVARSLFIQRTYLIGLIFPTTSNPFYGQLIFHLENICTSLGYKVLLCNSQNQIEKEREYMQMLQRNQVDGIIAGAHNIGIEEYEIPKLPVVAVDRNLSNRIPVVSSDNYDGGKQATEHLLQKGCKKIIHLNGPGFLDTPANLRRKSYEDVMLATGLIPLTYELGIGESDGTVIHRLFDEHPDVDGIFASDDTIAAKVIREAKGRNRKIPSDLKVIGYDGTETARLLLPELSTVQQPIEEIANNAVKILLQLIERNDNETELNIVLPVTLIDSETT